MIVTMAEKQSYKQCDGDNGDDIQGDKANDWNQDSDASARYSCCIASCYFRQRRSPWWYCSCSRSKVMKVMTSRTSSAMPLDGGGQIVSNLRDGNEIIDIILKNASMQVRSEVWICMSHTGSVLPIQLK